jgi:TetR/AcrR family transcriptional regulator, transcriptional repressor for nem operon
MTDRSVITADRPVIYSLEMAVKAPSTPTQSTRERLLDAGVAVAEQEGLAGLSVNRVVARAGLAKGTFYVHFTDRAAFIDALHERFHARVIEAVASAVEGSPPGAERIVLGAEAYLDVCLEDRAVKALALEARSDPSLTASMSARHERFAAAAVPSFKAMGWRDAPTAARLLSAMASEIALHELEAGRRLPAARRTLRRFLGLDAPAR